MESSPIVVCGLPRCGSSLTMQMLSAAGIRCAGQYPAFEDQEGYKSRTFEYVEEWKDGAFKLLDPHRLALPEGFSYRIVFLTRSRRQQALSTIKLLRLMGVVTGSVSDADFEKLEDSLRADENTAIAALKAHPGSFLLLRFEDLIARAETAVFMLADFLGLDRAAEEAMRKCVRPRSVTVYPGMLELELLDELEGQNLSQN